MSTRPGASRARPTLDHFQRPWPGITAPDCYYCSWAYRDRWPGGRMEIKYLNAACPARGHRLGSVMNVTSADAVGVPGQQEQ